MPVAWMLSTNGQQETITYFLRQVRKANPSVIPANFMSDKDRPQMTSVRIVYWESFLLLCWWHVLHAWQQHFVISHHPELWMLLKEWIRITDEDTFNQQWESIKHCAPASVIDYLEKEWLNDRDLWSAIARKDRSILELGDTNMLVEAYVHVSSGCK